MKILKIKALDQETENKLLVIWESSVRATHNFLSDPEINNIKKYVPHALRRVSHLIVAYDENEPVAFMGINNMGFKAVERSEFDDQGNPYPILIMKRV